mmetsp:Transcript_25156/g.28964  ORF Transcript_25156/g.28964 Transcript_25156/m.28964 type:complete len:204 (-) Transcript_25156:97-708(-)
MSTFENEIKIKNEESAANQDSFEQRSVCIHLQANENASSNSRKYSEMIRLDELERGESSPFHIPCFRGIPEGTSRKRMTKLIEKSKGGRSRIMTETDWMLEKRNPDCTSSDNTNKFCPMNLSEIKINSIQKLREKANGIQEINKMIRDPFRNSSIDFASRKPSITSNNSKVVNVVVLKREQDSNAEKCVHSSMFSSCDECTGK